MDYNLLFNHVQNLKIAVLLVCGGRPGSDFFQSLTDGNNQILQLPGIWHFYSEFWMKAQCKENLTDLIDEFIFHPLHISKFKSFYNKVERWDQLGPNRDEYFTVDVDIFKKHMTEILREKELCSKNFFLAVHLAYALTINLDILKTKLILYHLHHVDRLKFFSKDFENFYALCSTRDPRNGLVSSMENWKKQDAKYFNSYYYFYFLNRIFEEASPVRKFTANLKTIRLESLHSNRQKIMEEFCKDFDLEFNEKMLIPSYHGKQWWGDKISGRYIGIINVNAGKDIYKTQLNFIDRIVIEFLLAPRMQEYNYDLSSKGHFFLYLIIAFLIFLPMRYEKELIKNIFLKSSDEPKVKTLLKSVYYYFSRIKLYFSFLKKKITHSIYIAPTYRG